MRSDEEDGRAGKMASLDITMERTEVVIGGSGSSRDLESGR